MNHRRIPVTLGFLLLLTTGPARGQSGLPPPASVHLASWTAALKPNDIAADPETGSLAVIDAGNSRIEILRPGGTHREFREGFRDPRAAAFLPGGILLVGEAADGTVKGYDPAGRVVLTLGSPHGEFLTPNDIAVEPTSGLIYVVDSARDAVGVYRSTDGAFRFRFGESGTGPGQLRFPISVAVNPRLDEVYVGDARNRRIAVFDAGTGAFRRNIGSSGGADGDISFVGGLFIDGADRVFVVESLGGTVQMFDPDGGFIGRIGEHGNGPARLRTPKAVLIDRYNRLLVTSYLDDGIEVWGLDDFENPVDQDIVIVADPVPSHIHPNLPSFQVLFQVQGIDPADIDPVTLRINASVPPDPGSWRVGPHLSVRFSTSEVLATLPEGFRGAAVLVLTGATREGLRFESDLPVVVVAPLPEPGSGEGAVP